jgi:exodeoxyribonuclease V beta subunit
MLNNPTASSSAWRSSTTHPIQVIDFKLINQAYVIEASAGTGKTWTIERLFIKALLERPEIGLDQILVVTFTNASTNELKSRILQQLNTTINQLIEIKTNPSFIVEDVFFSEFLVKRTQSLEKDVALLLRSAQNFDQASIYTIHGFCHKVLQNYPLECNINYPFKLVSDKENLILTLVRNFFRERIINNPNFVSKIDKIYRTLEAVLDKDYTTDLVEKIAAKLPKDLFVLNQHNLNTKYKLKTQPNLAVLLGEADPPLNKVEVLDHLLTSVVEYLQQNYPSYNQASNSLSFDELIQVVAANAQGEAGLGEKLNHDFPIAFIDEFQDTDSLQWQIFSTIYGLNSATPRGTVVVVGDPKQAIYRFRGADIDVYLEARASIKQQLQLRENRRSHPNIMNFINQLFDPQINPDCFGQGLEYTSIEAKVELTKLLVLPNKQQLLAVSKAAKLTHEFYDEEVQLVVIPGKTADEKERNLLNALSLEILALLNAEATLVGKIAILVNKNSQARLLVNHLRQYGIKACELKLGNIFASTTANDLYLILASVLDLSNRKLFFKAITTQLFNLPIAQLASFETSGKANVVGGGLEIQKLQQQFFAYKQIWEKSGIISLIYQLINDSILLHKDNQHGITNRELSNLLQLGELLNKHSITINNPLEVLHWFKQKIVASKENVEVDIEGNSEELVRLDNDDEQIIITTQHKAKGLEYDVLFCPYFKADSCINTNYDFEYQLPFFAKYRDEANNPIAGLVTDNELANQIVAKNNKEIHRLNYVALTRAKSRIYIFLKTPTLTKGGKYHALSRPDKLVELFGYVKDNPMADLHNLFHYSSFFTPAGMPIKNPALLPGVIAYMRDSITPGQLEQLAVKLPDFGRSKNSISLFTLPEQLQLSPAFTRQSYSKLTHSEEAATSYAIETITDYCELIEAKPLTNLRYTYAVLNELFGAKFGILIHSLCENYPLTIKTTHEFLIIHNLPTNYTSECLAIVEAVFHFPLTKGGLILAQLTHTIHELNFNLQVKSVNLNKELALLLTQYFGDNHPYVIACKSLKTIQQGFLNGFIDLVFEYQGKYYILDYKTNNLEDYSSTDNPQDEANTLVRANAKNHYYLQYLLYLVAVKRYLQIRLNLTDATELLGGAIYYYVRGLFVEQSPPGGVYMDTQCHDLVRELDLLLGGI